MKKVCLKNLEYFYDLICILLLFCNHNKTYVIVLEWSLIDLFFCPNYNSFNVLLRQKNKKKRKQ